MKHVEIPFKHERSYRYRLFEILPGAISWSILAMPFILSLYAPLLAVVVILAYILLWFVKSVVLNLRAIQGFRTMEQHKKLPWRQMMQELADKKVSQPDKHIPTWHYENVARLQEHDSAVDPHSAMHTIIIAAYNESREVLEPTIQSVIASDFDMKRVMLVLAYEERGGEKIEKTARQLMKEYGKHFKFAAAYKHPKDMPGEVVGKGGNITYAAKQFVDEYITPKGVDPRQVIVTTLDSDNRPHQQYLAALTYVYAVAPNPMRVSFQPIPVFTNNIWDVPAPMRVIATGNTFWNVVLSLRPHMIRNFASHAQPLQSLMETNFWSVRTIVEDGHQFWRSYFAFDGDYDVYPIYLPIGQDAVLSSSYIKTLKAQFSQLRRWAYGASDIAYVAEMGLFRKNSIPKFDLLAKFGRLLEGHISWATAPFLIAFGASIPRLLDAGAGVLYQEVAVIRLPLITERIVQIALLGIIVTLYLSMRLLPPRPARYMKHRSIFMVFQWVLLPITTICYNGLSGLYSQTRLMFGLYLDKFDVTDKAVITKDNKRIM